jgi:hypothetical protein
MSHFTKYGQRAVFMPKYGHFCFIAKMKRLGSHCLVFKRFFNYSAYNHDYLSILMQKFSHIQSNTKKANISNVIFSPLESLKKLHYDTLFPCTTCYLCFKHIFIHTYNILIYNEGIIIILSRKTVSFDSSKCTVYPFVNTCSMNYLGMNYTICK